MFRGWVICVSDFIDRKIKMAEEKKHIVEKYGSLIFTRYDPDIAAKTLPKEWGNLPKYRINLNCSYIKPLYSKYKSIVSPIVGPITDEQRFDFESIIITVSLMDKSPKDKINIASERIESIIENNWDYVPYSWNKLCLCPIWTINHTGSKIEEIKTV